MSKNQELDDHLEIMWEVHNRLEEEASYAEFHNPDVYHAFMSAASMIKDNLPKPKQVIHCTSDLGWTAEFDRSKIYRDNHDNEWEYIPRRRAWFVGSDWSHRNKQADSPSCRGFFNAPAASVAPYVEVRDA